MIKILQNWQEIQVALQELQNQNLPLHIDIHKNWDHLLLYEVIGKKDKQALIVDLGCGECCTLDFLDALGFKNLHGVDLKVEPKKENLSYTLHQGDLIKTPFISNTCDVVISVSVIEHGVDLPAFFAEVSRLFNKNGLLFLTTDYWSEYIEIDSSIKPYGLPWKVFCQADVFQIISLAKDNKLILEEHEEIPTCLDKTITWNNYSYTFLALLFKKMTDS